MACSVDISTTADSGILKEQYGGGYARSGKPLTYHTYTLTYDELGGTVKSAEDLRKELKKAEKAERKVKAAAKATKDRHARALKNLERLAKGDNDAAFDAARYLYEFC